MLAQRWLKGPLPLAGFNGVHFAGKAMYSHPLKGSAGEQVEEVQMRNRLGTSSRILAIAALALLSAPVFVAAQSSAAAAKKDTKAAAKTDTQAAKAWTMARLPDGQPDLQGYWTSLSITPMERPAKYGNRGFLTQKETQDAFNAGIQHEFDGAGGTGDAENDPESADYDFKTYGLSPWQNGMRPNPRTSLVVDPPDGRIPPLTPEAKGRRRQRANFDYYVVPSAGENYQGAVHVDVPADLGLGTSCVHQGGAPPILPTGYNSNFLIVQSHDAVAIEKEVGSEYRVIPLDGTPHAGTGIRQWHGDGRGHWEGDTLVVETTNFRPENVYRNANPKTLKITERFKRVDKETIEYSFTVDDPSTWTKPWTAIVPLSSVPGPLFEYDCSENNNDAVNIMVGARNAEKAQAPAGVPISQK